MPKMIPELPDDVIMNTDNEPHTVQEILDHIMRIRTYLISGLVEMGFEPLYTEKDNLIIYHKWNNTDTRRNLWLTVEIVTLNSYLNVWVDKIWDGDDMGNGFYHKSLEWWDDLWHFLHVVSLAKG